MTEHPESRLRGFPVSEGVAIGKPYFIPTVEEVIPSFPITLKEVDREIDRYRTALFSSREDLKQIHSNLMDEGSKEAATIIDTHIQMLEDPVLTTHMEGKIRQMLKNTETVFHSVISDYETRFSKQTNPLFQEKLVDVMDLAKRVLGHLHPDQTHPFSSIPIQAVVFVKELEPSYTANANSASIAAFVTETGGGNSHAALIARAKGIPYVSCINLFEAEKIQADLVIVDGQTGEVIFNPNQKTLEKYKQKKTSLKVSEQLLQKETRYDAETIDGCQVQIFANIGSLNDLTAFSFDGIDGIGLFRTEYLFFERQHLFSSEQEQYYAYSELIRKMGSLPITIRVFDIGGDKPIESLSGKEMNPILGCRGIRFLLRHPELFKTQIRAILRAAVHGNVRILLPLICDVSELEESRKLIEETAEFLRRKGIRFQENIPIGSMIEVPSAVIVCDAIAQKSDFLSVGTNDLVQFTLGINRSEPGMGDFCYPAHPSVIRMIKMINLVASQENKPVCICGEIASNPIFIPLLLGLGVTEFSCSPRYLSSIKHAVRSCSLLSAIDLAKKALSLSTAAEVTQLLTEFQTLHYSS